MQPIIYIRGELVLEAHPDGPYILLRREGELGSVRVHLNEVRYLADVLWSMTAEVARCVAQFEWEWVVRVELYRDSVVDSTRGCGMRSSEAIRRIREAGRDHSLDQRC